MCVESCGYLVAQINMYVMPVKGGCADAQRAYGLDDTNAAPNSSVCNSNGKNDKTSNCLECLRIDLQPEIEKKEPHQNSWHDDE